jgi:hypothetical protein
MSLFMSESEWIVRCATHGGGNAAASAGAHAATAASAHADGAAHDHGVDHSTPSKDAGHQCSCPGPGCCPPAVAAVPGGTLPLAHIVAVHEATAVSTLDLFTEASDYLHPPATAPPAVALAPLA